MLEDHLGGIVSLCRNLIALPGRSDGKQTAILLSDRYGTKVKATPLGADTEVRLSYSGQENKYSIFRRIMSVLPKTDGALVSNSGWELEAFSLYEPRQTVFQIVHDAYNLRLAKRYEPVVDVLIAHSRYFHEQLLREFSHRTSDVHYLPYGIRLAPKVRAAHHSTIRLVFLGRLTEAKGVLDLPLIDQSLDARGVGRHWTIIGNGPERDLLMDRLPPGECVRYFSPSSNEEVLRLCAEGDIFVFPTRFEGFPVALLEAMSAGLVPVTSDLPSGIPEVVDSASGFRTRIGDIGGFAEAISILDNDRPRLDTMSKISRQRAEQFDIRRRVGAYHELFARAAELKRPWPGPMPLEHGSRLDQPFLPNSLVKTARGFLSLLH